MIPSTITIAPCLTVFGECYAGKEREKNHGRTEFFFIKCLPDPSLIIRGKTISFFLGFSMLLIIIVSERFAYIS